MALTQISTAGVKDDLVTAAKIADDAVTEALVADESVDEARLKISNAGTNGQYLQKQSGNTGGLTWADVPAGVGGATGLDVNDDVKIRLGTGNDLELYHSGSDSRILDTGTGSLYLGGSRVEIVNPAVSELMVECIENGSVGLYYDAVKKFETISGGTSTTGDSYVSGNLDITTDTGKVLLGNDDDLQIYHNGSESIIAHIPTSGTIRIAGDGLKLMSNAGDENYLVANHNGAVELYHDNVKKFETHTDGIFVTGTGSSACYIQQTTNNGGYNIIEGKDSSNNTKFYASHNGRVGASEGIIFGTDTATANVLDDYEEGTFDASVALGSGTGTYSYRSLKYVKIGTQCTVMGRLDMSVSVADPGLFDIGGFPFAMEAAHEVVGFMCPAYNTNAATGCDAGIRRFSMYESSSHIRMYDASYTSDGELGTTGRVKFDISFTYPTA